MYNHVVLGGTFDHFHIGHQDLLRLAFSRSKKVSLGLTRKTMNRSKLLATEIQSYRQREEAIHEFVRSIGRVSDLMIIPIRDIYGKTLIDDSLEAIIVTPHTVVGAHRINDERKKRGLRILAIEVCPLHMDSTGTVISSSRIRIGEIDRNGEKYFDLFTTDVRLSESAKQILKRPIGKATSARRLKQSRDPIVIVGDISTKYAIDHHISFYSAWIDRKTHRQEYSFEIQPPYQRIMSGIENSAGSITSQSATKMLSSFHQGKDVVYQIEGEEDLLTVAAVVLLPFGTRVIYGYPLVPQSLRCIRVSERTKKRFAAILQN